MRERVLDLVIHEGRMTPKVYIEKNMFPLFDQCVLGKDVNFVQDSAAFHLSRRVKSWFAENDISVINLPHESADLNIMENIWSTLRSELELMSDMKPVTKQDMVNDAWCYIMDQYSVIT